MRILKSELRLRLKNRKPRPFNRAASADDAGIDCGDSSTVSSPSTPNSSLSSQSNLIGIGGGVGTSSANTPSPATPTQQPTTPLGAPQTPGSGITGSSGHKNSLKGTKLARRARSFKDDLFEKISLMRTPTNTLGRSHSPHSPRNKHASMKPPPSAEEVAKSSQSLETHVKDISNALKHFRDVILKKKLEVLPGNGTVILETIASMTFIIQSYTLNESSTVLLSATQQVYQSLGKLIKLCDEVMLSDESTECASLSNENVREVVDLLEDAVRNLVTIAQQKLKEREESAFKYGPSSAEINATVSSISHNHLMRPPVEVAGQRTSLPDITLTPKERDILEKTKSNPIRASYSTESILRDTSPPPKPPLPNRSNNPPPLPPKRRSQQQPNQHSNNISINSDLDCSSDFLLMNYGVDHLSVRSRSPDENSSQCSLDSALNHSREEEELKSLSLEQRLNEKILEDDVEKMFAFKSNRAKLETAIQNSNSANKYGDGVDGVGSGAGVGIGACAGGGTSAEALAAGIQNVTSATVALAAAAGASAGNTAAADKTELRKIIPNNRHSNESGFVSMKSFRTSTQSVSKRSSDFSFQSSSTKSANSELAFGAMESTTTTSSSSSSEFHHHQQQLQHQQQQLQQQTTTFSSSAAVSMEQHQHLSSTKIYSSANAVGAELDNHSLSNASIASSEHFEQREKQLISQMQSMSSSLTKTNSLDITSLTSDGGGGGNGDLVTLVMPPALPPKISRQSNSIERHHLLQYDNNFDELDDINSFSAHDLPEMRHHPHQHAIYQWQSKHQSLIEPRRAGGLAGSCNAIGIDGSSDEPPPLPMKKKHILAYMEICSASTRSIEQHRHTMHAYNLKSNITHSQTMNIVPLAKELSSTSSSSPPEHETPPALPPKNYKQRKPSATPPTIITTPPPSPKPMHLSADPYNNCGAGGENGGRHGRVLSGTHGSDLMSTVCEELTDLSEEDQAHLHHSHNLPNAAGGASSSESADAKTSANRLNNNHDSGIGGVGGGGEAHSSHTPISTPDLANEEDEGIDIVVENNHSYNNKKVNHSLSKDHLPMLEEIDITPYLILKKDTEDGPEVKGGYIDALIVHASRVQKVSDNAFSEAFITTFRTFIQPIDVIEKLTHRYTVFFCQLNDQKQKAAKETFSLLVRVVNDLTSTDLTTQLLKLLMEFVYQLVCSGQLYLAKLLRNKVVEKVTLYKDHKLPSYEPDMFFTVTVNQPSLLDLKSVEIAEQMTLLDAELFQKIEIPEVLLFAKEQCEEKSPNLNKFTEHFNKMSYWARSKILMLSDAKEREKHVIKFIKIMKHLRKMNNYNSYLALLSALDSAPIRRLEWHKTITEGLKEYCTLIDSSSSFRVYRQALAETNPPCIPYIGLVLQDLTFVHVGNPDYLKECIINFSKRWQQHNIIVNMKRFKKCSYPFRRNDRIIRFFENFENFLGEEEMWQISETIKPRGKRPNLHN